MTMFSVLLLLVLTFATSDGTKSISAIGVDAPNGQIYIGETTSSNPVLYEVDCSALSQNAVHYLSGVASPNSFFVEYVGNHQDKGLLYSVLGTTGAELVDFKLPLRDQDILRIEESSTVGSAALSLPPTYNSQDSLVILPVSNNLTLANLTTFEVLDSFTYYGTGLYGRNLVYNYQNNHLISFKTFVVSGGSYGLSVDEFDLSANTFAFVQTTYNCQCEPNPVQSPFYQVVFAEDNCDIDYSVSPAIIWCIDPGHSKFFTFQANNLSHFANWSVGVAFNNVAWDFTNRDAYAIYAAAAGFSVYKINLDQHTIISSVSIPTTVIEPNVFELDPNEPHLYIAVANHNDNQPTQIAWVNTNTLSSNGVVSLNTNDLQN